MKKPTPLEQIRRQLALAVGENAVFDGWTRTAVDSSAQQLGIDAAKARLAMPKRSAEMIDLYIEEIDRGLESYFTPERLAPLKIRDKIRALIWRRLELMGPAREAIRRAAAILAMPQNVPLALSIGWRSADVMWRIAGDTSSDFNHYTKRMTLSAVYGSTLLVWLNDTSEGWAETSAFLDRRIEDVMKFETMKARWRRSTDQRLSFTRFLGRLRYPPRA